MNKWLKRALIAVPVLVALFFGVILFYVNVIREDPPDRLDTEDLSAAVAGTDASTTASPPADTSLVGTVTVSTVPATAPATTAAPTGRTDGPSETSAPTASTTAGSTPAASTAVAGTAGYDGVWTVTGESQFGYRVQEVLFGVNTEAVGRGNQITGELAIAGSSVESAAFTVDVASITSDEERRDGQFRGAVMETEQFPEASFTLSQPIDLGSVPVVGQQVTATATGDLTLHGVTRSVTFDVTAEAGDGRIGVLGSIPVTFADYDIDNPSRSGITTEDHGLLEFVLVLVPA